MRIVRAYEKSDIVQNKMEIVMKNLKILIMASVFVCPGGYINAGFKPSMPTVKDITSGQWLKPATAIAVPWVIVKAARHAQPITNAHGEINIPRTAAVATTCWGLGLACFVPSILKGLQYAQGDSVSSHETMNALAALPAGLAWMYAGNRMLQRPKAPSISEENLRNFFKKGFSEEVAGVNPLTGLRQLPMSVSKQHIPSIESNLESNTLPFVDAKSFEDECYEQEQDQQCNYWRKKRRRETLSERTRVGESALVTNSLLLKKESQSQQELNSVVEGGVVSRRDRFPKRFEAKSLTKSQSMLQLPVQSAKKIERSASMPTMKIVTSDMQPIELQPVQLQQEGSNGLVVWAFNGTCRVAKGVFNFVKTGVENHPQGFGATLFNDLVLPAGQRIVTAQLGATGGSRVERVPTQSPLQMVKQQILPQQKPKIDPNDPGNTVFRVIDGAFGLAEALVPREQDNAEVQQQNAQQQRDIRDAASLLKGIKRRQMA